MNHLSELAPPATPMQRSSERARRPSPAPDQPLPALSDAQLAVLAKLVDRHPGCRVEVQDCGGGFIIVRARAADTGKLVFASHIFPPWKQRI